LFIIQGGISFLIMTLTYTGFNELPLELGMSIFFSYPILWVIISQLFIKQQPWIYLPLFIAAYATMLFVIRPNPQHIKQICNEEPEKRRKRITGILSLIGAVGVSAMLFYIKRSGLTTVNESFFRGHIGTLLYILGYFLFTGEKLDTRPEVWMKVIGFSALFGFAATRFRMWGVEERPVVYYSIFIFLGTALAYLVGKRIPHLKRKQHPDFAD
jgi:hypothetical protein